jgi:hypothetical protein
MHEKLGQIQRTLDEPFELYLDDGSDLVSIRDFRLESHDTCYFKFDQVGSVRRILYAHQSTARVNFNLPTGRHYRSATGLFDDCRPCKAKPNGH